MLGGLLRRPGLLLGAACVLLVLGFQLWITPTNPPGFIRDEASFSYNAYTIGHSLRDQDGGLLSLYFVSYNDYKSPLFVYLLAPVFRVTGPHKEVARGFAAVSVWPRSCSSACSRGGGRGARESPSRRSCWPG